MVGVTIYCLIQFLFNFPNWISPTFVGIAQIIYVLYLASKDGGIGIEDLDVKILFVLFWLSLILTYPKLIYEDRKIIREKIRKKMKDD